MRLCNGSIVMPLSVLGFNGPMNNIELHKMLLGKELINSKTSLGLQINASTINTEHVYYLCDERKVLSIFTNQRFFRLRCDSPRFLPSISAMDWPKCYNPTHCLGKPAVRQPDKTLSNVFYTQFILQIYFDAILLNVFNNFICTQCIHFWFLNTQSHFIVLSFYRVPI